MSATRHAAFVLVILLSLFCFGPSQHLRAQRLSKTLPDARNAGTYAGKDTRTLADSDRGGIREIIDSKYQQRYQEWKDEFLSTEIGRAQWEMYSRNPRLVLTITIAKGNSHGAGSAKYKWNDAGELIAATITLGTRI